MRKLAIALAISLLPIFAVPANAGCNFRKTTHITYGGKTKAISYTYYSSTCRRR